jgi:hypothetical protein
MDGNEKKPANTQPAVPNSLLGKKPLPQLLLRDEQAEINIT